MATFHTSLDYTLNVQRSAPPGYPKGTKPDTFSMKPFASNFKKRKEALLDHWAQNPSPPTNKAPYYELLRMAAGEVVHEGIFHAALDYINERRDCADFVLHSILRLLYQFSHGDHVSPALMERAKETVLNFKYWPGEPGLDSMCTWTENHQILFNAGAYLAGQIFPDEIFTNSGQSGYEKMESTRPRILRWMDLRFRTGFSEWLSHVYYDEDLTALVNLVDFCQDKQTQEQATMVIDLILFDMAVNSFKGVFGSTHGRSYENTKKWAQQEGTTDTSKLLFGTGIFSGFDNMSASCLALSQSYRMPRVLYEIAKDLDRTDMTHYQRMGIKIEEADRWGLGFQDHEDGMVLLSLEAYAHPRTIRLVIDMFDAFNWWENAFFQPFKAYRKLIGLLKKLQLLPLLAKGFEKDITRNTREEVNITTYRTPDYMLSSAQDYRSGFGGDQQHIWQATLDSNAVCFTTHPAKREGSSPNYWTGSGNLPRVAQVQNVLIAIYRISTRPGLYVTHRLLFTHAWLPKDQFNEVVEREGWIFARRRKAYLALHSQRPYHWQTEPGEDHMREIIAPGRENIWICEIGRQTEDGTFEVFMERISCAPLSFRGSRVIYHSPSQGVLEFGWKGGCTQNGDALPLKNFPRYNNPYCQTDFPSKKIVIRHADHWLELDWDIGKREASALV
jgi:hypothetical protein